jgi:hypothetical protein
MMLGRFAAPASARIVILAMLAFGVKFQGCKLRELRRLDRMRLSLIATTAALLAGCAIGQLSNDVKPYVGRDIHELVARLGSPTGKQETTGELVYVWSADSEGVLSTTSGAEGTRTGTMTAHYECTLEVTVNAQNVIQSYQIDGSNAGCAAFRRHLVR